MAGYGDKINKLQMALNMQGRQISVSKRVFFSRNYQRLITAYKVKERDPDTGKNRELLKSYSAVEVMKLLAKLYTGGE